MTIKTMVLNYLSINSNYYFTIYQLSEALGIKQNKLRDIINTLIYLGKIQTFVLNNIDYYKIK